MGVYLPKPKTTKESEDGGEFPNTETQFGLTAMQGWRQHMEDAHLANPAFCVEGFQNLGLFGIFDGHGGPAVSSWVSKEFQRVLREELLTTKRAFDEKTLTPQRTEFPNQVAVVCEALQRTFLRLDVEMSSTQSRQELQKLHEESERKKREDQDDDSSDDIDPCFQTNNFLDALLTGGQKRMIHVCERDGKKYLRFGSDYLDSKNSNDTGNDHHSINNAPELSDTSEVTDEATRNYNASERVCSETSTTEGTMEVKLENFKDENNTNEEKIESSLIPNDEKTTKQSDQGPSIESNEENGHDQEEDSSDDDDIRALDFNGVQPYQPESCGTTAIVIIVMGGDYPCLIAANAGDSRAVLCRDDTAIPVSRDHKPVLRGETRRIIKAGGKVINGRVDGNLNLSRALGDLYYKKNKAMLPQEQKIISFPDVRVIPLESQDRFAVLACDGIWDCLSCQQVVNLIRLRLKADSERVYPQLKLSKLCEQICDYCICENPLESEGGIGCDNMTIMIVTFNEQLASNISGNGEAKKSNLTSSSSEEEKTDNSIIFYGPEPDEADFEEFDSVTHWENADGTSSLELTSSLRAEKAF